MHLPEFRRQVAALSLSLFLSLFLGAPAFAGAHSFLCCDHNGGRVCVVSAAGTVEWEYACRNPQDCWQLPNGNILFCFVSGAKEVTRDHRVVWEYQAPAAAEVHSCQPLPDGRVLVVEGGSSRLVEVDRSGRVAREIRLVTAPSITAHNQYRGARKTANGHYFVCFKGEGKVVELDGDGVVLRSIPVPGDPHEVVPLPGGHLLITCGDAHKVLELDADQKVVWELGENDLPGNPLRLMAGCQRLPNGNTVLANYLGHGHIGEQPEFFEVTRDKKVVWQFRDDAQFKTINQVQLLDVPGDVTRGEVLR